jgi:hypothetical protein
MWAARELSHARAHTPSLSHSLTHSPSTNARLSYSSHLFFSVSHAITEIMKHTVMALMLVVVEEEEE